MNALWLVQSTILWVLSLGALVASGYAMVDAIGQKKEAFPATDNQNKTFWLVLLIIAVLVCVASLHSFGLNVFAVLIAAVYLAKVRPAVRAISGGGAGPYGGW